jgi:hypothetical protein
MPGVLFSVTHQWRQVVCLRARLAVELCDSIIPGASVRHRVCMIGVLSITLCYASLQRSFLTLCSLVVGVRANIRAILSVSMQEGATLLVWSLRRGRTICEFVCP